MMNGHYNQRRRVVTIDGVIWTDHALSELARWLSLETNEMALKAMVTLCCGIVRRNREALSGDKRWSARLRGGCRLYGQGLKVLTCLGPREQPPWGTPEIY